MGWLDFRGLAGRAALATCLLLSTPASADPTLGSLLKYLPAPQSGRDIGGAAFAFVYSRLDLLAGSPEPSVSPGQARRPALSVSVPVAAGFAGLMQGPTDGWPAKVGFDLDAIDAMLVGLGSDTPALNPKIFASAPRLRDATVVGRTLEARGATRATVAGAPVWSWGADGSLNIAERDAGDPFRGALGQPFRVGMVADGLVVAGSNAALEAALSAAAGKSMADLPPVRALLSGLGEGATGVSILQAFAFWTAMYAPDTRLLPPGSGPGAGLLTPVEEDGPRLAQYLIGGLAEVRLADGTWRGRAVLVYPTLADATTAAVAMEQRVKAWTRDAPVATTRAARGVDGGLAVAILDVAPSGAARPGGAGSPFRDWVDAFMTRKPTPVVVGPVPSKPTPR